MLENKYKVCVLKIFLKPKSVRLTCFNCQVINFSRCLMFIIFCNHSDIKSMQYLFQQNILKECFTFHDEDINKLIYLF